MPNPEKQLKLLIVDDEAGVRKMLSELLSATGYAVATVHDALSAREHVIDNKVDVVISDVNMPGESGIDLLRHVRETTPGVRTLIMTGRPAFDAAVECIKLGAHDYLPKPLDLDRLLDVLNELKMSIEESSIQRHDTAEQQKVAGYTIRRLLGEGTGGLVFEAENDRCETVALKVFRERTLASMPPDAEGRKRFFREAQAVTALRHPNIVRVFDYGIEPSAQLPFITMELIEGRSLIDLINSSVTQSYRDKALVLAQVADALSAVHALNIVHRDVKPHNIMLTPDSTAKLMDFGVAKFVDSTLTTTGALIGSPAYMAPEGFLSNTVDARFDLYSLGVTAYQYFLGRLPFGPDWGVAVAMEILNDIPPCPTSIAPDFPKALTAILSGMLGKDPTDRYQAAVDIQHDFQKFAEQGESGDQKWLRCPSDSLW